MSAKVLILDIETQRAIVETFSLWSNYTSIDRVIVPSRILCFSAQWRGQDKIIFSSAWRDGDEVGYRKMLQHAWNLLDEADIVVTWNGDKFDLQWFHGEFGRLEMGKPSSYKSVDLIKVLKNKFKAGLLSMKLDWSARQWLHDMKVPHGHTDLWHDIRYGTRAECREACRLMREYCEHDTRLTGQLFERHLQWININMGIYETDSDLGGDVMRCTKCASTGPFHRNGFHYTPSFGYQRYRCAAILPNGQKCGGEARGKRSKRSTSLRAIP